MFDDDQPKPQPKPQPNPEPNPPGEDVPECGHLCATCDDWENCPFIQ